MEKPVVHFDLCVRSISRWVGCNACEACCPEDAVEISRTSAAVAVNDRCDSCGICGTRCPAEAVSLPHGTGALKEGALWVQCRKTRGNLDETHSKKCWMIPCVKEIGFRFLLVKWMRGARKLILLGADCSRCDSALEAGREDGVQKANEILLVVGEKPFEIQFGKGTPSEHEEKITEGEAHSLKQATSRRGFFKVLAESTLATALNTSTEKSDVRKQEKPSPRFLEALERLGRERGQDRDRRMSAYEIHIETDACYGCRVCATLCPTRALSWDEGILPPYEVRLWIDPSRCTGCDVCRDLCDVGAIGIVFRPDFREQESVLFQENLCEECSRTFVSANSTSHHCPGCRRKGPVLYQPGQGS